MYGDYDHIEKTIDASVDSLGDQKVYLIQAGVMSYSDVYEYLRTTYKYELVTANAKLRTFIIKKSTQEYKPDKRTAYRRNHGSKIKIKDGK